MPAGSDAGGRAATPAAPALPVRFRPLGVRVASVLLVVALFVTVAGVWIAFPQAVRDSFTPVQRVTVLGMGLMVLAIAHALARCRVDADTDGLTVVNGYRTHRFEWNQVVAVSLRSGNPWAVLDLSDGTTCGALGIQGSDGERARRQARALRSLVEARAGREPTG